MMKISKVALSLILFVSGSIAMANTFSHGITGWGYDQTTSQGFYLFKGNNLTTSGGEQIIGQGDGGLLNPSFFDSEDGDYCNPSDHDEAGDADYCDVVASFITHRWERDVVQLDDGTTVVDITDTPMRSLKCLEIGGTIPEEWYIKDDDGNYLSDSTPYGEDYHIRGCNLCVGVAFYGEETTVMVMGSDSISDERIKYYAADGDSISFKYYDSDGGEDGSGQIYDLVIDPSSTGLNYNNQLISDYGLDGWEYNEIHEYYANDLSFILITADDVPGCTDSSSCTYNMEATYDDGSCLYLDCMNECGGDAEPQLTCSDGTNVCNQSDCDDIFGCMDENACNYNAEATADSGDCEYSEENYDCNGDCIVDIDECGVCGGDGSTCNENSNDTNTPYAFDVIGVYPNPFNPSTTISYTLSNVGYTNIRVFDMDGREVEVLLNRIQSPGYYQLDWEPNLSLSSGNYFIHIQSSNNLIVKKVTLIK